MSLKSTRRLGLLAGASLVAASLSALTFTGVAMAPGAAYAFDECTPTGATLTDGVNGTSDPTLNGATADTFSCTGATTFATSGITYSSQGNLTVNTVGSMEVGAVGINLAGATTDNVTFGAGNTTVLTGSSGAVVDITSTSGNIVATTSGVNALADGATYGVRLQSSGAGNITYTKTGTGATNGVLADGPTGQAAAFAKTEGGNITMNFASGNATNVNSTIRGRLYGIQAQTSGAGNVIIGVTGNGGVRASASEGIAAIDVVAGTGLVDLNLGGGVSGGAGYAIRVVSAGPVDVDITSNASTIGGVDFSGVTAGGVTLDTSGLGTWVANSDSYFSAVADVVTLGGGSITAENIFAGVVIDFGGGADLLRVTRSMTGQDATLTNLETIINSGALTASGLTAVGLGAFDNSGIISMLPSDNYPSFLSIPGATFTGSGASRLNIGVVLGGVSQPDCASPTGFIGCLDLQGGTTAGSTLVVLSDVSPAGVVSGYVPDGMVFIDVSGGTTDPSHFTIDYSGLNPVDSPLYGDVFEKPGYFVYMYRYDAANQRHMLVSQPRDGALFDYAALPGAAQSIWRLTAETVTSRQAERRNGADGGGVWLRTSGEFTERDLTSEFQGFDGVIGFDNSYQLYAGTIIGGMDLVTGSSQGYDFVLGAQAGYVGSSFDLAASGSSGRMSGATGGVYGSLWSDWFFVDGAVNINGLTLDHDAPLLGARTNTYLNSVGARLDAGARTRITDNTFAEPLAAVSWVRTSFEEISLFGGEVQPADAESLRAGLGMRLGATLAGETVSASYFVTGRGWYEFEGESGGVIHNPGADLPFADEFTGAFGEAELGVNVFNAANTLSAFAATGVKWQDGYSAVNLSLGVRMAW